MTPGNNHYVVVKNDSEVGLVNIAVVSKDDLKKSGQLGDDGGRKNEPGLSHTGAVI